MIVYHGGSEVIADPDLNHSRKAVDFGAGFYVTQIESQARNWAEKRNVQMCFRTGRALERLKFLGGVQI